MPRKLIEGAVSYSSVGYHFFGDDLLVQHDRKAFAIMDRSKFFNPASVPTLWLCATIIASVCSCTNLQQKRALENAHNDCKAQILGLGLNDKEAVKELLNCYENREFTIKQQDEPDDMDLVNVFFAERRALVQAYNDDSISGEQLVKLLEIINSEYQSAQLRRTYERAAPIFISGVFAIAEARASRAHLPSEAPGRSSVILKTTCELVRGSIARPQFHCTTER